MITTTALSVFTDAQIAAEYTKRKAAQQAARLATATRIELLWDKCHDKYGRPSIQLDRIHIAADGLWVGRDRNLAVVVTLPSTAAAVHGRYLVNVRRSIAEGGDIVSYHATRKVAKAYAESMVQS